MNVTDNKAGLPRQYEVPKVLLNDENVNEWLPKLVEELPILRTPPRTEAIYVHDFDISETNRKYQGYFGNQDEVVSVWNFLKAGPFGRYAPKWPNKLIGSRREGHYISFKNLSLIAQDTYEDDLSLMPDIGLLHKYLNAQARLLQLSTNDIWQLSSLFDGESRLSQIFMPNEKVKLASDFDLLCMDSDARQLRGGISKKLPNINKFGSDVHLVVNKSAVRDPISF